MVLNISPAHLLQKNVLAVLSSAIWSQIANKHWSMAPGVNKGHEWPIWYNSVHLGPTPGAFWGICLSLQIVPKFVFVFRHVRVQFLCVAFVIGHRCLFTSCDFMEHSRPENRCSVKVTTLMTCAGSRHVGSLPALSLPRLHTPSVSGVD